MTSSYFMRSQKRTYATDAAKNAIVTAIQRTSCMANLLDRFREVARLTSKGYSFPASTWDVSGLKDRFHFYKFAKFPGWFELRKIDRALVRPGFRFHHQSYQDAHKERHCTNAQYFECNFHILTGALLNEGSQTTLDNSARKNGLKNS